MQTALRKEQGLVLLPNVQEVPSPGHWETCQSVCQPCTVPAKPPRLMSVDYCLLDGGSVERYCKKQDWFSLPSQQDVAEHKRTREGVENKTCN